MSILTSKKLAFSISLVIITFLISCSNQKNAEYDSTAFRNEENEVIFRNPAYNVLVFIANEPLYLSSINYNSFRLYFRNDSYTSSNIPKIKKELDEAYTRVLKLLNIEKYPYGIYLLAFDSKAEMKGVMGHKINDSVSVSKDFVSFVYNDTIRPQLKHEIFHLIASEMWGPTQYSILDEGGATYSDNFCHYDNAIYTLNKYFLKETLLFKIEDLIENFDDKATENDVITNIQSAGYFKYLYENYGVSKMRQLWKTGFENFEYIYGFSVKEFDKKWRSSIEKIELPKNFDATKSMEDGCV
jgi:hypothetical protein